MKRFLTSLLAGFAAVLIALPAVAGVLTDHAENKLLDNLVRGQSNALPTTWHIALGTNTCTDAGSPTEPADTYARQAVTANLTNWAGTQAAASTTASSGTGGTTSNNGVITWAEATASWGTLQSVWFMDASTAGNAWICIDLTAPRAVSATDTVRFPIGTLQFQIDN